MVKNMNIKNQITSTMRCNKKLALLKSVSVGVHAWIIIQGSHGIGFADDATTPLSKTNHAQIAESTNDLINIKSLAGRLQTMERNATPQDLRRYLTNAISYNRYIAIQVIIKRHDQAFIGDLLQSLEDDDAQVRVEAAIALVTLEDPRGRVALSNEMVKARQLQTKLISSKVKLYDFFEIDALIWWARGAGALADLGDSSGYDILKTNILYIGALGCKSHSVRELPRFIRFKDNHIDAEQLLLSVADDAVSRIDKNLAEHPTIRPSAELGYYALVTKVLAMVGGTQEIARLQLFRQHKNADVRRHAMAGLNELSRRGPVPPQQRFSGHDASEDTTP